MQLISIKYLDLELLKRVEGPHPCVVHDRVSRDAGQCVLQLCCVVLLLVQGQHHVARIDANAGVVAQEVRQEGHVVVHTDHAEQHNLQHIVQTHARW